MSEHPINPSKIMQVGLGFWASKTLLSAVNMGLFTELAKGALSGSEIQSTLGLHNRALYDFLDTLVALGFLNRSGMRDSAVYSNTPETDTFLDKNKPSYIGGILEMANNRLYAFWDHLEEALKTGNPQNEGRDGGASMFDILYADENRLKEFMKAMGGIQMGNFIAFATKFDFSACNTLCDLGGAAGYLSAQVALHNAHMRCISFDLPAVEPIARANVDALGVADKVEIWSGNFFEDEIPKADVITMGNILHDWGTEDKLTLMQRAYEALPDGGSLVVIENIIDDDRRENAFGLMMSLNMLIETEEGYDFSFADFNGWARQIGFSETRKMPLTGPSSAVIAVK